MDNDWSNRPKIRLFGTTSPMLPLDPHSLPLPPEYDNEAGDYYVKKSTAEEIRDRRLKVRDTPIAVPDMLSLSFYKKMIEDFAFKGIVPVYDPDIDDDMYRYLCRTMNTPEIRIMVFYDEVSARIFYEQMCRFVRDSYKREETMLRRSMSEQESIGEAVDWDYNKRQKGWKKLWERTSKEYDECGFASAYFLQEFSNANNLADDTKWRQFIQDWKDSFEEKKRRASKRDIDNNGEKAYEGLKNALHSIPDYLRKKHIETDKFRQICSGMGGEWNMTDFERLLGLTHLQDQHPELEEAARMVGRIPDEEGKQQAKAVINGRLPLSHSTHSDIEGVIMGSDIHSLLPYEKAQCADDDMNSVFLIKYLTGRLQNFRSQSEQLSPNPEANPRKAHETGPIIVCLDTSLSMEGKPEKIAQSLLLRLLTIAQDQRRDLLLIAFSVEASVIDLVEERSRITEFFKNTHQGDTDATKMLEEAFRYLEELERYTNADLLLISDFLIPMVNNGLQDKIRTFRENGGRFYGLKIGRNDNPDWPLFFDRIWHVMYKVNYLH